MIQRFFYSVVIIYLYLNCVLIKIAYSVVRNLNNSSSLVFLRMRYQENSSLSVLVGIFSKVKTIFALGQQQLMNQNKLSLN